MKITKKPPFIVAIIGIGLLTIILLITKYNAFTSAEAGIKAAHDTRMLERDNMVSVLQGAGLTIEHREKFVMEVSTAIFEGRYGEGGSRASTQWIHEAFPDISPQLETRMMQLWEAKGNAFTASQIDLRDRCRTYEAQRASAFGALVSKLFSFPHMGQEELDRRCSPIVTSRTKAEFERGELEEIDPFSKPAK